MSDLDTTYFEKHSLKILKEILREKKGISVITQKETLLTQNTKRLVELNRSLSPNVLALAEQFETMIYPSDLALFLLAAKKADIIEEALDILLTVEQDRRLMSLNDLTSALQDSAEMPGAWAAALYGELGNERDARPIIEQRTPSIDLAKMFKGMKI